MVRWEIHREIGNILIFMIFKWFWWLKLLPSYKNNFCCQIIENLYYFLSVVEFVNKTMTCVDLLGNHT